MSKIISCIRPRSEYQVLRFVPDSPKLCLTCTKRGRFTLYTLEVRQLRDGTWVEKPVRVSDPSEQALLLNRAARFYNLVAVSDELRARATSRRKVA